MTSAKAAPDRGNNVWRGKWSLITGASAGIGMELARLLASRGSNLLLTARRRPRLESLAAELSARHHIAAEIVVADLAARSGPSEIFDLARRKQIPIHLLVNNAGFGAYGRFAEIPIDRQLEMVQVNCAAVVHLTHLFLPQMLQRGGGDILIVASTAAFQAVPYIATYAATKAFDCHFGEALFEEYAGRGIRVCVLCPGPTESEFAEVAGAPRYTAKHYESSAKVARVGLDGLARGQSCIISGALNNLQVQALRFVPRRFVTGAAARLYRPRHNR